MNRITLLCFTLLLHLFAHTQIGKRFPSERKVIKDPVTGTPLVFLTSTPMGDSKIYPTHNQWTSDGQWIIFRSGRVKGEVMAVHERSGDMVQVSEGGYTGMLNVARKSMKLYYMRRTDTSKRGSALQVIETDLARLLADSKTGRLQTANVYQRVCGTIPADPGVGGDMGAGRR